MRIIIIIYIAVRSIEFLSAAITRTFRVVIAYVQQKHHLHPGARGSGSEVICVLGRVGWGGGVECWCVI